MSIETNNKKIKILLGGFPYIQKMDESNEIYKAFEVFKEYYTIFSPDIMISEHVNAVAVDVKQKLAEELNADEKSVGLLYARDWSAQHKKSYYITNFDITGLKTAGHSDETVADVVLALYDNSVVNGKSAKYPLLYAEKLREQLNESRSQGVLSRNAESVGLYQSQEKTIKMYKVYNSLGKSLTIGTKKIGCSSTSGLYCFPVKLPNNVPDVMLKHYCQKHNTILVKVQNKQYSLGVSEEKLPMTVSDGVYELRPLSIEECCLLNKLPSTFLNLNNIPQKEKPSEVQQLVMLGNVWSAEVIINLLTEGLKQVAGVDKLTEDSKIDLQIVSMFDGVGTGRYCIDEVVKRMCWTEQQVNIQYIAYENDSRVSAVARRNFGDRIKHYRGDVNTALLNINEEFEV